MTSVAFLIHSNSVYFKHEIGACTTSGAFDFVSQRGQELQDII